MTGNGIENMTEDKIEINGIIYTLHQDLGHGKFGHAYLATHSLGEKVCVKVQIDSPVARQEVTSSETLYGCKCPSLVKDNKHYYVMPYFEGNNLKEVSHKISLYEKLIIAKKLEEKLNALHNQGYLHQDLKASNIMVHLKKNDIDVNIIDFGWSTFLNTANTNKNLKRNRSPLFLMFQEATGPEYVLPQFIYNASIGTHSDVYSFGKIFKKLFPQNSSFVELLTGYSINTRTAAFRDILVKLKCIFSERKSEFSREIHAYTQYIQHSQLKNKLAISQALDIFDSALIIADFTDTDSMIALQKSYYTLKYLVDRLPANQQPRGLLERILDFFGIFMPIEVKTKKWLENNHSRFFLRSETISAPDVRTHIAYTPPLPT